MWGSLVDVALGLQAALVVGLLRVAWRLSERVARLEGMLEPRAPGAGRDPTKRRRL